MSGTKNPSSSNNNQFEEDQKENGQSINNDENDEEENEIDEIIEEEKDEDDNNNKEKDETQTLKNPNEEGQSRLEKIFIYLRTGKSWRPIPTINSTVLCQEITGAIFIVIGIIIVVFSNKIKEIQLRYDNKQECDIGNVCRVDFKVEEEMEKIVFVYYRLKNFYQNHRRYIKSKSIKQLKGNFLTESDIKEDCDPITKNKDLWEGVTSFSDPLKELDPEDVAHPCGLIAKSFFNDTYKIYKKDGSEEIIISPDNIAWSVDKDKYKNSENTSAQWRNVEDERFMVWMRPAAMPDFRKPWGRIEKEIKKGEYYVEITNNYPVKSFKGEKYFILSTVNGLGGKNYFLAVLYFIIGGISIISGIAFWFGYKSYNSEKNTKPKSS